MKVLLIGGAGFIGPFVAQQLQRAGHSVTVFHRGNRAVPADVAQIVGDRNRLADDRDRLAQEKWDVVIDFVLSSAPQAEQLMETFRGIAGRVVALSSMDVYRAWGVFYGFESGPEELPIDEESAVRAKHIPYPPEVLKRVQQVYPWMNEDYEKILVERAVSGNPDLPATILRLPMIYGPGDPLHRFHPVLKRIDDGRRQIIFANDVALLRTPRGYVEDIAASIVLAAISPQAAGRIYNVCESEGFGELDWARKIAAAVNWDGEFVVLPHDRTPKHLLWPGNTAQHLVVRSDRIRQEFGYRETLPREEAFRRTIQWERAHTPVYPLYQFDYAAEDEALRQFKATA
jgi:nucleoside-diphosphate-sugar epimerase